MICRLVGSIASFYGAEKGCKQLDYNKTTAKYLFYW